MVLFVIRYLGLQIPSKKVGSWGVSRRLSTFLEGVWSPRVYQTAPKKHTTLDFGGSRLRVLSFVSGKESPVGLDSGLVKWCLLSLGSVLTHSLWIFCCDVGGLLMVFNQKNLRFVVGLARLGEANTSQMKGAKHHWVLLVIAGPKQS